MAHHFYYRDLLCAAAHAGVDTSEITGIEAAERELSRQARDLTARRAELCNALVIAKGDALKPHLRPCHQRELAAGKLTVYATSWETSY